MGRTHILNNVFTNIRETDFGASREVWDILFQSEQTKKSLYFSSLLFLLTGDTWAVQVLFHQQLFLTNIFQPNGIEAFGSITQRGWDPSRALQAIPAQLLSRLGLPQRQARFSSFTWASLLVIMVAKTSPKRTLLIST